MTTITELRYALASNYRLWAQLARARGDYGYAVGMNRKAMELEGRDDEQIAD